MLKLKLFYLMVTFILPLIILVTVKTLINIPQTIFFHILIGLLFVILSRLLTKPFERWVTINRRDYELWDWAFDTRSPVRGSLYAIFLITAIVIQINP